MNLSDKIIAVDKMQSYIHAHLEEEITLDALSCAAGYSKYYSARIFRELTGNTPFETIRALRLTKAAKNLRDSNEKVLDVALDNRFDSHDGFTRAFSRQFGITPQKYRRELPAIGYFISYPVKHYFILKDGVDSMSDMSVEHNMTVTAVERPARKLILKRARKAKAGDYFAICEELGCEWEGQMLSIPERLHGPAGLTLPPNLITLGTTDSAVGTEVPLDYNKPLPKGVEAIELPPCTMLYFRGALFENPDGFSNAIGILWKLMDAYDPGLYGWEYTPELAPYCNFGAEPETGALMARPVRWL